MLLVGAAQVREDGEGRGRAPRRSTPADRVARAKRGRSDVAAGDDVPGAHPPKRHRAGAHTRKSGRHGVYELGDEHIRKATPWLKWRAQLSLRGNTILQLEHFATVDDAAQAYDAEVRRRGWVNLKPLNFPQPEELATYPAQPGSAATSEVCPSRLHRSRLLPPGAPPPRMAPRVSGRRSSVPRNLERVGYSARPNMIPRTRQHRGGQKCT